VTQFAYDQLALYPVATDKNPSSPHPCANWVTSSAMGWQFLPVELSQLWRLNTEPKFGIKWIATG